LRHGQAGPAEFDDLLPRIGADPAGQELARGRLDELLVPGQSEVHYASTGILSERTHTPGRSSQNSWTNTPPVCFGCTKVCFHAAPSITPSSSSNGSMPCAASAARAASQSATWKVTWCTDVPFLARNRSMNESSPRGMMISQHTEDPGMFSTRSAMSGMASNGVFQIGTNPASS